MLTTQDLLERYEPLRLEIIRKRREIEVLAQKVRAEETMLHAYRIVLQEHNIPIPSLPSSPD